MFKPPFELYRESDIADQNGHVCTAENRDFARAILHALNALYVDQIAADYQIAQTTVSAIKRRVNWRKPRQHDSEYLDRIRKLPCLVCGRTPSEAAHIRYASAAAAKTITGMGRKPDDRWTLPLCPEHHREQHKRGEFDYFAEKRIDPIFICLAINGVKAEYEASCQIVRHAYFHS